MQIMGSAGQLGVAGSNCRLNEAVQLQPALAALGHRIIDNVRDRVIEEQGVSRGGGQRLGKLVGVAGEQVQWNGLGRQVGADIEELQPRRVFVANPLEA